MTRTYLVLLTCIVSSCAVAACSSEGPSVKTSTAASSSGSGGGGGPTLPEPVKHRDMAATCTGLPPNGSAIPNVPNGVCKSDADCTDGDNGRCNWPYSGENVCMYDECFNDADCGGAEVCACRVEEAFGVNVCFHGNCQLDSDCGNGGYCSPSGIVGPTCTMGVESGSVGYFCHTAKDECTDDADCGGDPYVCLFSVDAAHWVCQELFCLG